jgi:uncharacterized protein
MPACKLFQPTWRRYARCQTLSNKKSFIPPGGSSILPGGSPFPSVTAAEPMPHKHHPAIVRRLKRADGHLQAIINMIEQGRPCAQIAQQLQAVEGAVENAKKALIHDHISDCIEKPLRAAGSAGRAPLKELRLIAKYL